MNENLCAYIQKLEDENASLKNELAKANKESYGWTKIKHSINDELSYIESKRPYSCFTGRITDAIATIVRRTFNLSSIAQLDFKNYDAAQEITETIINLIKKNIKE